MSDIFALLTRDHLMHQELLEVIADTSGDSKKRRDTFNELKAELVNHAKAEERAFYAPLLAERDTQELATHSLVEHEELEDLIAEVEGVEWDSPVWLRKLKVLQDRVIHHENEEENDVFPVAEKSLTADQQKEFAKNYKAAMQVEEQAD